MTWMEETERAERWRMKARGNERDEERNGKGKSTERRKGGKTEGG